MRKTKIVCTLGPATDGQGVLRQMIQAGMNVFPEVFVPDNPRLTPYGNDPRINSACHAWSCAPAYFLRKK